MEDIEAAKTKVLREIISERQKQETKEASLVLTDSTFRSAVNEKGALVVDFWAEWCYPCRLISPIVERLAEEYRGRITFAKLNVDENPATAQEFEVLAIPTLLVFKNGQLKGRILGALPERELRARIESALAE
jgi:thioredoxin 1